MFIKLLLFFEKPGDTGGGESELSRDLADLDDDKGDEEKDGDPDEKDEKKEEKEEGEDEEDEGEGEEEEELEEEGEKKEEEEEEEEEEEGKKKKVAKEVERDVNGRPTVKAIKAKYPDLFKDFPELKHAFFTLPRYQELFADPDQAQEAYEKAGEFDKMESSIVDKGDPSLLIKTLAENNPRALKKMIASFPDSVRTNFEDGYIALTTPIIEELLYHAFQHGTKTNNKNLSLAARHLSNFVFANGGEILDVSQRKKSEPSEAEKQLEVERAQNSRDKFENAVKAIMPPVESALDGFLNNKLEGLTPFERKAVVRETRAEVDDKLKKDSAFQSTLTRLWDRAKLENYSDASKERIKTAWLSRAKQAALPIRSRLRQEALDARSGEGNKSERTEGRKRTFPTGGQNRFGGREKVLDPRKIDWHKTSDMDIINGKV